jgi:predicted DNA-binding mobile mystery protein A
MFTKADTKRLRRRQIDQQLTTTTMSEIIMPREGWIREVRTVLGMSARQLALRVGMGQPAIARLEKSEAMGNIEVKTLRRVAEGMNCRLVYAFIPQEKFLEETLRLRAQQTAERVLTRVEHTMTLEAQGSTPSDRQAQVQELAEELMRTMSREIWEEVALSAPIIGGLGGLLASP